MSDKTIDDGGQAFPHGDETHGGCEGMKLRDWFAGMALQGLLSCEETEKILFRDITSSDEFKNRGLSEDDSVRIGMLVRAQAAYAQADAMIAARKEQP